MAWMDMPDQRPSHQPELGNVNGGARRKHGPCPQVAPVPTFALFSKFQSPSACTSVTS